MSERTERIEELVAELCDLNRAERLARLDQACGADESLREEVVRRLRDFDAAPQDAWKPKPGAEIGKYRIEERLGDGTYGEVWRGYDRELERPIALKILHETGGPVERALEEARATAAVRDPNVVQVLDAGLLARSGRAYIAMELCGHPAADDPREVVPATSLTQFTVGSDGVPTLRPREAAEYIRQAAQGVAAVHRSGVYHLDLKPDNLLLTPTSQRIQVTDFGLVGSGLAPTPGPTTPGTASVTLFTPTGRVCGTPAYMCPEQARGERPTPLFDVYGLGSTLYFLLTGSPPYESDGKDNPDPAQDILAKVLRDSPRSLAAAVPGLPAELAAICDRAMARDPARRYGSPAELAADLSNWLSWHPVVAFRSGRMRRLYLWYRRNILPASLGTAVVASLAIGTVTSTLLGIQAEYRRGVAENETIRANYEKDEAQALFRLANRAVNTFTNEVSHDKRLLELDAEGLRKDLIRSGLPFYLDLIKRKSDDPDLQDEFAAARFALGHVLAETGSSADAQAQFELSRTAYEELVRKHPKNAEFRSNLGSCYYNLGVIHFANGRPAEGELLWNLADEIWTALVREYPDESAYETQLLTLLLEQERKYSNNGREEEATLVSGRAEAIRQRHPVDDQSLGEFTKFVQELARDIPSIGRDDANAEGIKHLQACERFLDGLGKKYPASPQAQLMVARGYAEMAQPYVLLKQPNEARRIYDKRVTIFTQLCDAHPSVIQHKKELVEAYLFQGGLYVFDERYAESRKALNKAIGLMERLVQQTADKMVLRQALASANKTLGHLERSAKRFTESETAYRLARDLFLRLVQERPDNVKSQASLAELNVELARTYLALKRPADALSAYQGAADVYRRLVELSPADNSYLRSLGRTLVILGELYRELPEQTAANRSKAKAALNESRKHFEELVNRTRKEQNREDLVNLARTDAELGDLYHEEGRLRDAGKAVSSALKIREEIALEHKGPEEQAEVAQCHMRLGNLYREAKQFEAAESSYRRAMSILGPLTENGDLSPRYLYELSSLHVNMSFVYDSTRRPELAIDALMRAVKIQYGLVNRFPENPEFAVNLGGGYVNLGHWERNHGSAEKALDWYARGIGTLEPATNQPKYKTKAKLFLRNAHWGRASTLLKLNRPADSLEDWEEAIRLSTQKDHFELNSGRAETLAKSGNHARAIEEVSKLSRTANLSPKSRFELARIAALAAEAAAGDQKLPEEERGGLKQTYSLQALELLQKCADTGYFNTAANREALRTNKDFEILSGQPQFKHLSSP